MVRVRRHGVVRARRCRRSTASGGHGRATVTSTWAGSPAWRGANTCWCSAPRSARAQPLGRPAAVRDRQAELGDRAPLLDAVIEQQPPAPGRGERHAARAAVGRRPDQDGPPVGAVEPALAGLDREARVFVRAAIQPRALPRQVGHVEVVAREVVAQHLGFRDVLREPVAAPGREADDEPRDEHRRQHAPDQRARQAADGGGDARHGGARRLAARERPAPDVADQHRERHDQQHLPGEEEAGVEVAIADVAGDEAGERDRERGGEPSRFAARAAPGRRRRSGRGGRSAPARGRGPGTSAGTRPPACWRTARGGWRRPARAPRPPACGRTTSPTARRT